jgi:chaperonin cofactor prefoldin
MTDEEINRKFDTVADHLATLAVSQQKSDERVNRLERALMLAIRAGQRERKDTREKFGALVDAQARTEEALARLAESQQHTDERLNALIDIVREGRNGKS